MRYYLLLVCPNPQPSSGIVDSDPTQLIPLLLDQLVILGDLARQISHALVGNGHRPEELAELVKQFTGEADGNP